MAKDLAVILNSGTINSAVATALAVQKFRPILLHVEITPQQGSRLRASYDQQVAHFKPYREHTLPMHWLQALHENRTTHAMTADPRLAAVAPRMLDLMPLLAAAVRFAAHYEASAIYTGFRVGGHGDDLAQAAECVQIWNELIQLPCALPELDITVPLLELEPWQVIDVGFQVGAPFDKAWSCAEDGAEPCWACAGCRAREAAFQQAAKPDPLRVVRKL